jgi:hypothetical protein
MAGKHRPPSVDPTNPYDPVSRMASAIIKCPKCGSSNFEAKSLQWGLFRKCLEPGCGNEWSGGSVAMADASGPPPLQDVPAIDDDIPLVQYTGASFRNPARNTGGDDEW